MNTLDPLFDWIVMSSLRATLLSLAVILIQSMLRGQLTARWRYALWLPVLAVLILPVLPQSRWSLEQLFIHETPTIARLMEPTPTATMAVATDEIAPAETPLDWAPLLAWTWLFGAGIVLLTGAAGHVFTLRRYQSAMVRADESLQQQVAQIAAAMRLRRMPQLCVSAAVESPAVTGVFRPLLLLPASFTQGAFTPDEARLVLKHELTHLQRGDLILNAVLCVLMALHWFNPLLWLAYLRVRQDREAACDADVLAGDASANRAEYGHALIKVQSLLPAPAFSLGLVGMFVRGAALRTRIQAIAQSGKPRPLASVLSAVIIAVLTFAGATRAASEKNVEGFKLGQRSFMAGDDIRILSVQRSDDSLAVMGEYELGSQDEAVLALYITASDSNNGSSRPDPQQRVTVKKGKGAFTLTHPKPYAGMPHVTFYRSQMEGNNAFGGVYFGTAEEALASNKVGIDYAKAANNPSGRSPLSLRAERIILPKMEFQGATLVECIEFLQAKSKQLDPEKLGLNFVIDQAVRESTKAQVSMSLTNVPLSEALRYITELAGVKFFWGNKAVLIKPTLSAASELLKVQSKLTTVDAAGKLVEVLLPTVTAASGREFVITTAPYTFKVTAKLLAHKDNTSVLISSIIEKADATGKSRVYSRPTIYTLLDQAAKVTVDGHQGKMSLEQSVSLAEREP